MWDAYKDCWYETWECPKEPISGPLSYAIVAYYSGPKKYEWFPCVNVKGQESYPDGSVDNGTPHFPTDGQRPYIDPDIKNDAYEICCQALVEQSLKMYPGIDWRGFDDPFGQYNDKTWCVPDNPGRGDLVIYSPTKGGSGHVEFVTTTPTGGAFQAFGSISPTVNVGYRDRTKGINGDLQFETFLRPKVKVLENICKDVESPTYIIPRYLDPLVLDLDSNGIQTIGTSSGIHFDQDKNGFKELTGWVAPGDGMLMLDINGNGRLDSGRELFGDFTILPNGVRAGNGFQALAYYDGNGDGKIDASDPIWSQLRVWQYNDVLLSWDPSDDDPNSASSTGQRYFVSQDASGCG